MMSMRYFTNNGETFGYESALGSDGAYIAKAVAAGWTEVTGNWPPAASLGQVQAAQIAALTASYQAAIAAGVSYTSQGGVTKTYQTDSTSLSNIQNVLLANGAAGAVPSGFYWVSADNTHVPFSYADVQALAAAIFAGGWTAFQHLQTQKAAVLAAGTVAAVQAIGW